LQIGLMAGRNFSDERPADRTGSVMVNETLVKELGWEQPIGKRVQFKGQDGKTLESQVIGVVADFHIYSLQHKLQPLVLQMPARDVDKDNLYVRVNTKDVPSVLAWIKDTYRQFDPAANPIFHFLSDNFNAQYQREQKQGTLLLSLTVLAISIACLGLFGLVTYTALQKSKEIGIRKVLGASVGGIVRLLSLDLVKLVFIAFVIATPVAWMAMRCWLRDFAYQVDIGLTVFLIAGAIAMTIALVTISVQAVRSALANPVKTLKVE
jgi:putative ABC transport system permease protein